MTTHIWVDSWDPTFGTSLGDGSLDESSARLTLDLETPPEAWAPVTPAAGSWTPSELLIIDGVRRIDARVWFSDDDHPAAALGIAASVAAGVVRIDDRARVAETRVGRGIFTSFPGADEVSTPIASYPVFHTAGGEFEDLQEAVQQRMGELEIEAAYATRSSDDDLMIMDGPLRNRTTIPRAIGYIKSHRASYLPANLNDVVVKLRAGERTPVFTIGTTWSRRTWYLRLPTTSTSPWAGIVRCEAAESLSRAEVLRLADTSATVLPRLASEPYKDARAPQNLIPIGGLEKALRHLLGDSLKLHRALAATTTRQLPTSDTQGEP